jgi:hypothetical protein
MALGEKGQEFKVKHTKYSGMKIMDAREALAIVHDMADEFSKEIAALCATKVDDAQFLRHLQIMVPISDDTTKISMTNAEKKRAEIVNLYHNDLRVAPWKGTAYGVSQAYNTWRQHFGKVKGGVPRQVRNMENLIAGKTGTDDKHVLDVLASVVN